MNINDQYILKRIRKGDIKAFESLFHRYHPGMILYALKIVKNKSQAEEITQDVFYNIWKNRKEFYLKTNWHSYLYKSVYNNSLMILRKSRKNLNIEQEFITELAGNEIDPSEEMDLNLLNGTITKTLESLPDRTKEIFRMSRFEGMKYREIASHLSISIKTVEANMGKAIKAFRLSLKNYGY